MFEDIFNPKILMVVSFFAGIVLGFLEKPTMKYFLLLLIGAVFFYFVGLPLSFWINGFDSGGTFGLHDRSLIWVPIFVSGAITVLFRWLYQRRNKK